MSVEPDHTGPCRWAMAVALIPTLLLLPFVNKAYHVDDTLFVYAAQKIVDTPLDFYGFEINWYATPQPMSEVMQNPPLQAYWLALVGASFGWSEIVLHVALLPWALAACWLTTLLSVRFGVSPGWAVLGLGLSPAFFVSATQIMCDVVFLTLYVGSIYAWIRGLDRVDIRLLALGATVAAAALLTKYFGVTLVPLLTVYTLYRGDTRISRCLWLALPLAVLLTYEVYTYRLYGRGLFVDAMGYALEAREQLAARRNGGLLRALVFLPGCLTVPALWAVVCLGRWGRRLAMAAFVLALLPFSQHLVHGGAYAVIILLSTCSCRPRGRSGLPWP